jgi:hypothetical protein
VIAGDLKFVAADTQVVKLNDARMSIQGIFMFTFINAFLIGTSAFSASTSNASRSGSTAETMTAVCHEARKKSSTKAP